MKVQHYIDLIYCALYGGLMFFQSIWCSEPYLRKVVHLWVMSLRHVWLVKHEVLSMLRAVCHGCKSKVYDRVRIIEYCLGTELRVKQWNTIMVLPAVEQSTSHDHVLPWSWSRCSHGQHSRTQSLLSGAAHSITGHCLHYNNLMSITQWTKHFYEPQLFS